MHKTTNCIWRFIIDAKGLGFNIGMKSITRQHASSTWCRSGNAGSALLWTTLIFLLTVAAVPGALAARKTGNAPLDTLRVAEGKSSYNTAGHDFSRKILPDVPATKVPQRAAPHRPPRLDDPLESALQFNLARKAFNAGNGSEAEQHLRAALRADSRQSRYHWWQTSRALKRFDVGAFVWTLPVTIKVAVSDQISRKRLLIQAHQELVLQVAVFWTLLVITYLVVYWRYLAHDLTALLMRGKGHELKIWLPVLIPVVFLTLRPGWLGLLALISILLVIQARGRQRWLLVGTWTVMAFLVFPHWPVLRNAAPALDPESETNLLLRASQLPPADYLATLLEERIVEAKDPDRRSRLQLVLGIQRSRAGHYGAADQLFNEVLRHDPDNVPARIGIANNTYYTGKLDAAVQSYLATRRLAPKRGEIAYNLAQVYFKKLFVPEASAALKDARQLGFDPPPWEDKGGDTQGFSPMVYLGPTTEAIEASCRWENSYYPPLSDLAAWSYFLGCPPLSLFILLVAPLVLALAAVYFWSNQKDPRNCDNCGTIICRVCCRVRDGIWLCSECGETADRARSEMVLATLLKNRSRAVGMAQSQRIITMSRFLPGAGHLALGEMGKATGRLVLLATGITAVLFGWSFDPVSPWRSPGLILAEEAVHQVWFPLPVAAWQGWLHWSVMVGCILIGASCAIAFLDAASMRHRVPERYLLGTVREQLGSSSAGRT